MAARRPELAPQGFILCTDMISINRIRLFTIRFYFYRGLKITEFSKNETEIYVKIFLCSEMKFLYFLRNGRNKVME